MGRDHPFHLFGLFAAQMQDGFDGLHFHAGAGEFKAAGADFGHQPCHDGADPVGHFAQGEPTGGAGGVFFEAFDGTGAVAFVAGLREADFVGEAVEEVFAARVAHDQPLLAFAAHVADGDVGEAVGVVDASAAGEREEVGGEVRERQFEEGDFPFCAVCEAEFDVIVSSEFEVGDAIGVIGETTEEVVEILACGVVGTRRADDVEAVEVELFFDPAECVDLTGDADDGEAFVARLGCWFQKRQKRRVAHAHAADLRHLRGVGDDDRHGFPFVIRVGRHGEDGIDSAVFEEFLSDAGRKACPLCALKRLFKRGAIHFAVGAEEAFIVIGYAGAALDLSFHRGIIRADELAGLPAFSGHFGSRQPAISAKRPGCCGARLGRVKLRWDDVLHGGSLRLR